VNIYRARLTEYAGVGLTGIAFLCVLAAPALAVQPASADATEHNARVAEYLLQSHTGLNEHNARVAEYLMLRHSR
jgi:hypothetical protein